MLPGAPAAKAAATTAQSSSDRSKSSNIQDQEPSDVSSPKSRNDNGTLQSSSKTGAEASKNTPSNVSTPISLTQTSAATEKPNAKEKFEMRVRPQGLNFEATNEGLKHEGGPIAGEDSPVEVAVDANVAQNTPSQPTTPATAPSAASSMRRSQPKTIRTTKISKNETPSPSIAPSQGSRQASRRPSVTSLNRPETPASERISDTVSYASAPMSRAGSPPPSKIGSTPTRRVTKSQHKKERQERAKKAEGEAVKREEPAPKFEETVVQAPIVGRKKKTKKLKEKTGTTADSTPAVTRPASPELQEPTVKKEMPPPASTEPVKISKENKKQIKLPPIAQIELEPSQSTIVPGTVEPGRGTAAQITAAEIFAHLQATGELPQSGIEALFKPVTGASHRFDHNLDPELILSAHHTALGLHQVAQLDNNEPVVVDLDKNNALVVLPNRRCLKGLTPTQAYRYRDLHLQGHRANPPPSNTDALDAADRLMPTYQSWCERPAPAAISVQSLSELAPTAPLTNRFANHSPHQTLPPAPLNTEMSASRSLLNRGAGHDLLLSRAEKRVLELDEAEAALAVERKNTDGLEKKLNALIRKNKRLMLGSGN